MDNTVEVTGLYIYPVKSLKGIAVDSHPLTAQGLAGDRHWMVVMPNGRFVTQRQLPQMATVSTALDARQLVLSAEGCGSISVARDSAGGSPCEATVWRDDCEAIDEGAEVSAWLTEALQSPKPLRLVRLREQFTRPQSKPDLLGANTSTHFADAAPYLVAYQASLDELNRQLQQRGLAPVDIRRFRPNILVSGLEAFAEHRVSQLRHSRQHYVLRHCFPCQRCTITTIDQDLGTRDADMQPFKTLIDLNRMPGNNQAPAFGENTVLEAGAGAGIQLGDRLSVVFA